MSSKFDAAGVDAVGRYPGRILPAGQATRLTPIFWEQAGDAATAPDDDEPFLIHAEEEDEPAPVVQREPVDIVDIEARVKEAYEKGLADARQEARAAARAEYREAVEKLAQTTARLHEYRSRIRHDAEQDLVKLSIAIARRLIRRELTVDPESVHGIIRVALEKMQARDISRLRVHPSHVAGVKEMLQRTSGATGLEVAADPSLQPGDAIFETSRSELDATIESQLREIERGFADRLPK